MLEVAVLFIVTHVVGFLVGVWVGSTPTTQESRS